MSMGVYSDGSMYGIPANLSVSLYFSRLSLHWQVAGGSGGREDEKNKA